MQYVAIIGLRANRFPRNEADARRVRASPVSARQHRNDQPTTIPSPPGARSAARRRTIGRRRWNIPAARRASTPLEGTGRRARRARRTRGGTRGVITTYPGRERRFACEVTLRVGKFVRLQRDLGVNTEGAALIVELLDRIDALEHRLRHFEGR